MVFKLGAGMKKVREKTEEDNDASSKVANFFTTMKDILITL